jgi:anti-sigma regulatory factor (Ser/Thr protein kinase)
MTRPIHEPDPADPSGGETISSAEGGVLKCSVEMPPELSRVAGVRETVRLFLTEAGCSAEEISACELALAEACNNAVQYTKSTDPVRVELELDSDRIQIRIRDHTVGFDLPEAHQLPSEGSESGRGLFLMNAVMDTLEYRRETRGNALILTKNRRG